MSVVHIALLSDKRRASITTTTATASWPPTSASPEVATSATDAASHATALPSPSELKHEVSEWVSLIARRWVCAVGLTRALEVAHVVPILLVEFPTFDTINAETLEIVVVFIHNLFEGLLEVVLNALAYVLLPDLIVVVVPGKFVDEVCGGFFMVEG